MKRSLDLNHPHTSWGYCVHEIQLNLSILWYLQLWGSSARTILFHSNSWYLHSWSPKPKKSIVELAEMAFIPLGVKYALTSSTRKNNVGAVIELLPSNHKLRNDFPYHGNNRQESNHLDQGNFPLFSLFRKVTDRSQQFLLSNSYPSLLSCTRGKIKLRGKNINVINWAFVALNSTPRSN